MKKTTLILLGLILLFSSVSSIFSQANIKKKLSFSAGMGIDYLSSPSYVEYLHNEIPYFTSDSIKTYSTGVEFFGAMEYGLGKNISVSIDYSYFISGRSYNFSYYVFDYTITSHQPGVMIYYNLFFTGFRLKIGAGGGYHFHMLENNISADKKDTYKAGGVSARLELIFAPVLSKNLSAYVSGFITGNFTSSLKNSDGTILKSSSTGEEVNLRSYGPGARLGFTFNFN